MVEDGEITFATIGTDILGSGLISVFISSETSSSSFVAVADIVDIAAGVVD